MEVLLILQLIAHLLADFFLQSEKWCISKQSLIFRSPYLYLHVFIVFICSWGFSFSFEFLPNALFIAFAHFLLDTWKSIIENKYIRENPDMIYRINPYLFIADQAIHLVILYVAVVVFSEFYVVENYLGITEEWPLITVAAYMIVLKPSNVVIRCFLLNLHLNAIENEDTAEKKKEIKDLERAGRWIGTIERVLALTLVLTGQYTAIGFIIAAKSILRFSDRALRKTEYVLVGTLLSFGIAILLGLAIQENVIETFLYLISRD